MTIVVHPLSAKTDAVAANYYRSLAERAERGQGLVEAVVMSGADGLAVGDRYLFDSSGDPAAHFAARPVWGTVISHRPPLAERRSQTHGGIAFLPGLARLTIFLVGGGHVAQAVAKLAAEVDFDVWVLDDRDRYASRERFPDAQRLIVGDIGPTLRDLVPTLTPNICALVITRGHNHDEEALFHLATSACGYVGMIGSKRKIRLIYDDLIDRGVSAEALAKVHAPLGLPIGSQTVPEIAVSIVAELIKWRNLGPES